MLAAILTFAGVSRTEAAFATDTESAGLATASWPNTFSGNATVTFVATADTTNVRLVATNTDEVANISTTDTITGTLTGSSNVRTLVATLTNAEFIDVKQLTSNAALVAARSLSLCGIAGAASLAVARTRRKGLALSTDLIWSERITDLARSVIGPKNRSWGLFRSNRPLPALEDVEADRGSS